MIYPLTLLAIGVSCSPFELGEIKAFTHHQQLVVGSHRSEDSEYLGVVEPLRRGVLPSSIEGIVFQHHSPSLIGDGPNQANSTPV